MMVQQKVKLTYPWWDLPVDLTSTSAGAVAREVVEAYGDSSRWVMANLGTRGGESARLISLLEPYGMAADLSADTSAGPQGGRAVPGTSPDTEK